MHYSGGDRRENESFTVPFADGGHMPEEQDIKQTRSHHSVLPEVETLLSIRTHPKAVCHLTHDQISDRRLQLDADDSGIVRLHVKARKEWKPIEMHLEYTGEGGRRARHTIALRADNDHKEPISPNQASSSPAGTLHPALTGDLMAPSNRELGRARLPPAAGSQPFTGALRSMAQQGVPAIHRGDAQASFSS